MTTFWNWVTSKCNSAMSAVYGGYQRYTKLHYYYYYYIQIYHDKFIDISTNMYSNGFEIPEKVIPF